MINKSYNLSSILIVALLGFAITIFLIMFLVKFTFEPKYGFSHSLEILVWKDTFKIPYFKTWIFFAGFNTAFWTIVFFPLLAVLIKINHLSKGHRREKIISLILFIIIILLYFPVFYCSALRPVDCDKFLEKHGIITLIPLFPGSIITYFSLFGITCVYIAIKEELMNISSKRNDDMVKRYLELKQYLNILLFITSSTLGLSVFAYGTMRHALNSYNCRDCFHVENIFIFGIYFSMVLALAYLPTFLLLMRYGKNIRDKICPISNLENKDKWLDWINSRNEIDISLSLKLSATNSIKTITAIFFPVISSTISSII